MYVFDSLFDCVFVGAFFNSVVDPEIGGNSNFMFRFVSFRCHLFITTGTYITFLYTISNLGWAWPKFVVSVCDVGCLVFRSLSFAVLGLSVG